MLKGYKILTSFCVICATLYGGAYGAASVRGGATSRAGSIRTLGAGTTASVKATTSRTQPATIAANANTESVESVGGMRMSYATGLGGSKLPGKVSGTSTSGDNQNVAELRQAIEQLRNDYDALGEQYNNLLGDVSNVSDTAQVAHETATNNTNTLTVVRSDLSVAKSDIEDLKATGGFDEERVQEALDTTLAQRNYATRGELAATDAVARGAVQVADLPQTLNALNIADKDYVASRTQGVVNDSLNITLENYYTKGQVDVAIDVAKTGMVDKQYVDHMVDGLAAKTYVDNRVASVQTGVSEGAVQGIIDNSIDTRLGNYYTKGDIDNAIVDAIGAAKDGMADRDFVNNQVRDTMQYVDEKIAEKESGVDADTLYNILETRGYKTGTEVQGIVNDSINNTMANYYTKGQVDVAIDTAKKRMVDKNYVDFLVDGLVDESRVNTIVDNKVNALPLGLDRDAVKTVVEEYGYKDEAGVQEMINASGHVKTSELPDLIKQWAPGADIQYDNGVLIFKDKNGNQQTVDIRGLDGQDGAQVEIRQNDGWIQWHYEGDTEWNDLVAMSDLKGADGKSVDIGVISMSGIKNALVWKKEGETNSDWRFLYNLDDINGVDGCGVRAEKTSTEIGTTVTLLKDCPGQQGHGDVLVSFDVLNGAKGTVDEQQIIDALESNSDFMQLRQLKNKVNDPSTGLESTYNLVVDLYDRVDHEKTGLAATNTLANKAWSKVEDLEETNKTAREYVDDKIGDLGYNSSLYPPTKFASVAAKLGDVGPMQTVAEYVRDQVSKVNTSIEIKPDYNGYAYICNTGRCTGDPYPNSSDWTRISMDLTEYLTKSEANDLYARSELLSAVDAAQQTANMAIEKANQSWGKLDGINTTVKSYVEDYVGNQVGNLGFNIYANKPYSVADKLGFTATPGTVKEYIDKAVSSVNTKIRVERSPYDGKTYICKNGDACTSQPGPYSTDEWVPVSVDMSGYLTENDADKLYATITALNGVQATANEAKTAATAAQTNATQAQNAASAAQSTANDAWGKLSSLEGQTVKEYVEDKLSGISTEAGIQIEQYNGSTYICKKGTGCRTPVNEWRAEYEEINMDGYLTDAEAAGLYAQKSELDSYALKSDIGTLGGSFASVGDKIGLNAGTDYTKSVKQYVDDKFGSISTTIQIETSNGTTYICKQGSGCPTNDFGNTYYWAPVAVNLGELGTNPSSGQAYNVATKIGLIDSANINKTVVGYIGEQIGSLGTYYDSSTYMQKPHSVLTYLQANYTPLTKLGTDITSDASKTVADYISAKIGVLGGYYDSSYNLIPYTSVKQYVDDKFALKANIGTLGGDFTNVGDKIGLNSTNDTTNSAKTVKQYIDGLIGNLGGSFTSVAAKLGLPSGYSDKTIAEYVEDYVAANAASGGVTVGTFEVGGENKTYICSDNCTTTPPCVYPTACGWQELDIDVSSKAEQSDMTAVQNILAGFGTGTGNWGTVKGYIGEMGSYKNSYLQDVNYTVETKIGLNTDETKNKSVTQYIADKLGFTGDNANKTVAAYVAEQLSTVSTSVIVRPSSNGSDTYICTGTDCTTHYNDPENDADTGGNWTKLNVDLTAINTILSGFGSGDDKIPTVKDYVDGKIGTLGGNYTNVGDKINISSGTVKSYVDAVDNRIGSLGSREVDGEQKPYTVETKIGGIPAVQTIKDYIDTNMPSIDVRPGSSEPNKNKLYICTKPNCGDDVPGNNDSGWVELDIASAISLSDYLTKNDAASTYLPQKFLKLVREGAAIHLKRVVGDDVTDYGIVAGVQDLMCRSYRTETVEPGQEGCPESGSACYKMICNTNGND